MALKEILSSKEHEDKILALQTSRENLLKEMITIREKHGLEKARLTEEINQAREQAAILKEVLSKKETREKMFQLEKEKEVEKAKAEVKSQLNRQNLDKLSGSIKEKEAEIAGFRESAVKLRSELLAAQTSLTETNEKFRKEIEWIKGQFKQEKVIWTDRFEKEAKLRREITGTYERAVHEKDRLSGEFLSAKSQVERFAALIKEKEQEILRLKRDFGNERAQIKNLYDSGAEQVKKSRDELSLQLKEAEEGLRLSEQEKGKLVRTVDEVQQKLSESCRKSEELEEDVRRTEDEKRSLERSSKEDEKEYESRFRELTGKLSSLTAEKDNVEKEKEKYVSLHRSAEEKYRGLVSGIETLRKQFDEAKLTVGELNGRLVDSKKEISSFEEKEKLFNIRVDEIGNLKKQLETLRVESGKAISEKDKQIEGAQARIQELSGKLDGFSRTKTNLTNRINEISLQMQNITKQRDVLLDEKAVLSMELAKKEDRISQLQDEVRPLSGEISAKQKEIERLGTELKGKAKEHAREVLSWKNKVLDQQQKIEGLFERINQFNSEIAELKAAPQEILVTYRTQIEEKEREIKLLNENIKELKDKIALSEVKDEKTKQIEGETKHLEDKLAAYGEQIKELREKERQYRDVDSEIVKKDAQLKETSSELASVRSEFGELEKSFETEKKKFEGEIAQIKEKYALSRRELEEKEQFNLEIAAQAEKYEKLREEMQQKIATLLAEKEQLISGGDTRTGEISARHGAPAPADETLSASYEAKIDALNKEIAANAEKVVQMEKQLGEAGAELENLRESSSKVPAVTTEIKSKISELEDMIAQQKNTLSEKMEYIKEREKYFRKQLKKKDEEISVLKSQLELGLEALASRPAAAASEAEGIEELKRINAELKEKSLQREGILKEEIEKKSRETEEYRAQIKEAQKNVASADGVDKERAALTAEVKKREDEMKRLKESLEGTKGYSSQLEKTIKEQEKKISELQKKAGKDILKKNDITSPGDNGEIRF